MEESRYADGMNKDLIEEARGFTAGSNPDNARARLINALADALEEQMQDREMLVMFLRNAEQDRDEFKRMFVECHSFHLDGVQRAHVAEKELHDRELHHFEVKQELADALETAEKRATEAEAEVRRITENRDEWASRMMEAATAVQERDAALARATEAEARATEAEARVAFAAAIVSGNATFERYEELDRVTAERDAALAVIEEAKAHEWSCWGDSDTHRILSSAPVDVLRERDAEKWDEGWVASERFGYPVDGFESDSYKNPYRKTEEENNG